MLDCAAGSRAQKKVEQIKLAVITEYQQISVQFVRRRDDHLARLAHFNAHAARDRVCVQHRSQLRFGAIDHLLPRVARKNPAEKTLVDRVQQRQVRVELFGDGDRFGLRRLRPFGKVSRGNDPSHTRLLNSL